jgi:HSP20 family protein
MLMDAWRADDRFLVEFDLPGVDPASVDLDVDRNVLTVTAQRPPVDETSEFLAAERPRGVFSRQLVLGDNLDLDRIQASYRDGVLRLVIPVAEKAKPRKISISHEDGAADQASPPAVARRPGRPWTRPPRAADRRPRARVCPPGRNTADTETREAHRSLLLWRHRTSRRADPAHGGR